jgi:hypothetical protein
MGAAANKQLLPDKSKHASIVFDAVRLFEQNQRNGREEEEYRHDIFQLPLFKRHVLLAATASKKAGKDIDNSIAQLNDHDLEMLWSFIEKRRLEEEEEELAKKEHAESMTVEEFVEDDLNASGINNVVDDGVDNIDETTSVLSYGDDEVGGDSENEIEIEESSGSLARKKEKPEREGRDGKSHHRVSSNDMEDLEGEDDNDSILSTSEIHKKSTVKIFPIQEDAGTEKILPILSIVSPRSTKSRGAGFVGEKNADVGIAEALAKFWDVDELTSVTSQLSLANDDGPFSPMTPKRPPKPTNGTNESRKSLNVYKDRGKTIDESNEALMGLQRKKVISFTQNAQLEREVEVLQKQLERLEQLEKMDASLHSPVNSSQINSSFQSSSSTVLDSSSKRILPQTRSSTDIKQWNPSFPYIYPIDEEANEWNGSHYFEARKGNNRNVQQSNNNHSTSNQRRPGAASNNNSHNHRKGLSSSSDEENNQSNVEFHKQVDKSHHDYHHISPSSRNVPPDSQLRNIKSIRNNSNAAGGKGVRRRPYGGGYSSSGADSDDSSSASNFVIKGNSSRNSSKAQAHALLANNSISDSENYSHNAHNVRISPRLEVASFDENHSGPSLVVASSQRKETRKVEGRRARNTISNDDPKMSSNADSPIPEEEKASISHKRRGNDRLKRVNRRRHSLDDAPGKDSDLSTEALLAVEGLKANFSPIQHVTKIDGISPSDSHPKRPLIKRLGRKMRGESDSALGSSDHSNQKDDLINKNLFKGNHAAVENLADHFEIEASKDASGSNDIVVLPSDNDTTPIQDGAIKKKRRGKIIREEKSPKEKIPLEPSIWSNDLDFK